MLAAAWTLPSCRDVPAPEDGIAALAPLSFPLPGLVAGDTMRDSTGAVAPLTVVAFDNDADTVHNVQATFVVLDTGAHLSGVLLIGDTQGKAVRVIGSAGALQTQPATVKVTLSPDTLVAVDSAIYHRTYTVGPPKFDTTATSPDMAVTIQHDGTPPTGVEAVIVRYEIERAPPLVSGATGPSLILMSGTTPSSRDTTDATGRAARSARLRVLAINPITDTAIVTATASYRGQSIGVVRFTLIFVNQ
ncbi:MAG TPA: hypothetical protein VKH19_14105 [Gemmatimonadaceae bacterium]|nr:hypothetical protein [Gemmatimonadaceae bacterium]